jgi:hypothetical protein
MYLLSLIKSNSLKVNNKCQAYNGTIQNKTPDAKPIKILLANVVSKRCYNICSCCYRLLIVQKSLY